MKLRSIGSLLGLGLLSCSSGGSDGDSPVFVLVPRWNNQQRVPTASHLRAVRFNNASQGFVAGFDSSIYRTDDGGLTWRQEEHQPFNRGGHILGFDFLGSELHAVGSAVENGLGRYWTSGDALNWSTPDADGAGRPFVSVDVTQSPAGTRPFISWYLRDDWRIAIAQGGTPVDSTTVITVPAMAGDPGNPTPPAAGIQAFAIDMLFDGPGYVVGEDGTAFKTDNFANNWVSRSIGGTNDLLDVQILGPGVVFACGEGGTLVWSETDAVPVQITGGPAGVFRGVFFIHNIGTANGDTSKGIVVGDGGLLRKISGLFNGTTWTWTWSAPTLPAGLTQNLWDVQMVDDNVGYAVGDDGVVLKTTDGGDAWTMLSDGTLEAINAVCFEPSGVVGVAAGDNGWVYRTLNGGASWTRTDLGAMRWTGVSIPPGNFNVAFLCGEDGNLARNLDLTGAGPWTVTDLGSQQFRAIHFPTTGNFGVVVGDGSTLLYTVSGTGIVDWDPPAGAPVGTDYKALCSTIDGADIRFFAGGTNGVIATNTLGGLATVWTPVGGNLAAEIRAIQAAPNIVFVGYNHATSLQRSLSLTPPVWQNASLPPGPPPPPMGLAFPDPAFGWWVSDRIYTTENGADPLTNDWKHRYAHTTAPLRAIWMNRAGTVGYAVGERGTILKTVTGGK